MKENYEIVLNMKAKPKYPYVIASLVDIAELWADYDPEWESKLEKYIEMAFKAGRTKSSPDGELTLDYQSQLFSQSSATH